MPLDINETTQATEAIENGVQAVVDTLADLGQRTEQLVSDATRNDGAQATAADLGVNAASLYVAWMKGAARLATNFVDNLVLITETVTEYWTSDIENFPAALPAGSWRLEVSNADDPDQGVAVPTSAITVFDGDDRPVGNGDAAAQTLDAGWNGKFRIVLWRYADPLDELDVTVRAVDSSDGTTLAPVPEYSDIVLLYADELLNGP